MDVEYIPLETNDDFLTQGVVQAVGKELILVKNSVRDGDIFVFDRNGKALRKINRMGQGSEEYLDISGIALDEDDNEMFVYSSSSNKILIYDLYGKFKRSFQNKEETWYSKIYNYDKEHLICHEFYVPEFHAEKHRNSFFIVSKQDGRMKEVEIPFKKKISVFLTEKNEGIYYQVGSYNCLIIPFQNNWIITEPSSDTVYRYLPDDSMYPFIVRTPSVQSMNPEVFLFPGVLTDRYYFMQTVKKKYDFATNEGMPSRNLMYDRQEKTLYEYIVYNDDRTGKRPVNMVRDPVNEEIAFCQKIEAYQLVEAYEKGELKGKLKEIAAELDEESNPVIMVVKYKK